MEIKFSIVATDTATGEKTKKHFAHFSGSKPDAIRAGQFVQQSWIVAAPTHSSLGLDTASEYEIRLVAVGITKNGREISCFNSLSIYLWANRFDQPDQDFTATVGVDEVQDIAVKEIARRLTAAELESVYAYVRGNYNFSDGLSYENFRVAIEDLNFDVA